MKNGVGYLPISCFQESTLQELDDAILALNKGGIEEDNTRTTAHFLFSARYCGSMLTGFIRTEEYMGGHLDLGTAMAISGAAFSPQNVG